MKVKGLQGRGSIVTARSIGVLLNNLPFEHV